MSFTLFVDRGAAATLVNIYMWPGHLEFSTYFVGGRITRKTTKTLVSITSACWRALVTARIRAWVLVVVAALKAASGSLRLVEQRSTTDNGHA